MSEKKVCQNAAENHNSFEQYIYYSVQTGNLVEYNLEAVQY